MTKRVMTAAVVALVAVMLSAAIVLAAEATRSTPSDQESVSLTIYNANLGLVKDVRKLTLPRGVHDLWFEGVAASIDPTSVHIRSLSDPKALAILEQNFEYDLIEPAKLMEKYVGRTIELVRHLENGKEEWVKAKLLGTSGGYVYEIDGKIAVNPAGRAVLPALPEGLIAKPSLVWLLDNRRAEHTVEASYLTSGISWKANYVAVLDKDDKKADLSGWVTIDNRSGATYEDAKLKLVAGDVNRVQDQGRFRKELAMEVRSAPAPQFQEEAFFEYHLYTLQRPATLRNNQTKQISLLSASDIGVKKSFVYSPRGYFMSRMGGPDKNTKVGVYVSLENSEDNGLGMPLPKGVVRVYKKDSDGALQFIGEDSIDHTPTDETVRIKMGNAFDVVAERVQTDFQVLSSGHLYQSSYKVTIRNHKKEDIVVQVVERLSGDWTIERKSHEFEKESSHRVRFDVPVNAQGSAELTYTATIRY